MRMSIPPRAAARGRLPLAPSRLAALWSRFSSAYPAAAATTDQTQTPPDPRAETRPASARDRDARRFSHGRPMYGGIVDVPGRELNPDAIELARFAVAEYNSKTNAALDFVRLVKVRQLVAGTMNYLTVEVREVDGGVNKLYEAKVWLRPWEKFKGLQAFEPVANAD